MSPPENKNCSICGKSLGHYFQYVVKRDAHDVCVAKRNAVEEAVEAERNRVLALMDESVENCFCVMEESPCAGCMEVTRLKVRVKAGH